MTSLAKLLSFMKPDNEPSVRGLWIVMIPITIRRRMRKKFFDGPEALNYPGRRMKGYRSPNVLMAIWLRYWAMRWFTPAGRALFLLLCAFGFISAITIRMPAYILASALFSLIFLDIMFGFMLRPKLHIVREHTSLVEAGQSVTVKSRVRNVGPRSVWDLVVDILPVENGSLPKGHAQIKSLHRDEQVEVRYDVTFDKRGERLLPQPMISSTFPFGLWHWSAKGHDDAPIYVYAAYTRLESLNFPLGREGRQGRELFSAAASESNEFMGCREYRYGDNPRLIHAASWARHGKPVVKEFREEYLPHAALLVDNFRPRKASWRRYFRTDDLILEAGLKVACAVSDRLTNEDYLLDIFVPGWKESTHLTENRGVDQLDAVLQLTAGVDGNEESPFHGPTREQMTRIEELQNLMVVMLDWDEPRQEFIQELNSRRVGTKVVVVSDTSKVVDETLIFLDYKDVIAGNIREL